MRAVGILLVLAGCDKLFDIETVQPPPVPGMEPLQEVVAQSATSGSFSPLTFPVLRTGEGHALVIVAALATGTKHLVSIEDDAGNQWLRAGRRC